MKKIFFIGITCLLLTGCTVNYNLEIKEDSFNETISGSVFTNELEISEDSTDLSNDEYLLYFDQPVFIENDEIFYNKTLNNNDNKIDFEYSYSFNENNIEFSRLLNTCFENYKFENDDNKYTIHLYGKFNCNIKDANINVITNNKVIAHNANSKNKNTYTWNIEEDDNEEVNLFITIDKNENNNSISFGWNMFKTIGLIIILLLSGISIFILKKKQNSF